MPSTPNQDASAPTEVEVTESESSPFPVFGPPRTTTRKPRQDDLLMGAVEEARAALLDKVDEAELGDHVSAVTEDDRLVTHRFQAHARGYRGWEWFVTLARAPRSKKITICEFGLLPGKDALLSPEWVPWIDRASEEERIRLKAISDGVDPRKALAEAGFDPDAADVGADTDGSGEGDEGSSAGRRSRSSSSRRRNAKRSRRSASASGGGTNRRTRRRRRRVSRSGGNDNSSENTNGGDAGQDNS